MLEEKVREWKKTKSVALASEICEILAKIYDDNSEHVVRSNEGSNE